MGTPEEILATAGSTILGMGMTNYNNQQQLEQQQKLQDMQIKGQKELGKFNQQQAMDMWNQTNYKAQTDQMRKAGLNIGLMYKGAGQGGTTQGGQAGAVSGGQAKGAEPVSGQNAVGMGLQYGLQAEQTKANIELTKAETEKVKRETPGVDVNISNTQANTANLTQQTENAKVQGQIMELDKQIKEKQRDIMNLTIDDQVQQIQQMALKTMGEATQATAGGAIANATTESKIKLVNNEVTEQLVRINSLKLGQNLTVEQTKAVTQGIEKTIADIKVAYTGKEQEWQKLDNEQRNIRVREIMAKNATMQTEFNTSTPAQIQQWIGIAGAIVGMRTGIQNANSNEMKAHSQY
ncbi:MAG: hypothetical protein [Microviridae sp.]|nr:MAG: hypothetical protein [Microviridae sp.]